jgi:hypothetical protein
MSTDGWQMAQSALFSDNELAALQALAQQWPTLSPAQQDAQAQGIAARHPDLELTTADVTMILAKIQELGAPSEDGS